MTVKGVQKGCCHADAYIRGKVSCTIFSKYGAPLFQIQASLYVIILTFKPTFRCTLTVIVFFRGYRQVFKRTTLETSDYTKDDCLSVNCSVGVVKSHTKGPVFNLSTTFVH